MWVSSDRDFSDSRCQIEMIFIWIIHKVHNIKPLKGEFRTQEKIWILGISTRNHLQLPIYLDQTSPNWICDLDTKYVLFLNLTKITRYRRLLPTRKFSCHFRNFELCSMYLTWVVHKWNSRATLCVLLHPNWAAGACLRHSLVMCPKFAQYS